MLPSVIVDNSDVKTAQSKENGVSTHAAVNGVLKMLKQKKQLHAKMRDLKQKMNTSDEMLKKQRHLLYQFQHIERRNKQNRKNYSSMRNPLTIWLSHLF